MPYKDPERRRQARRDSARRRRERERAARTQAARDEDGRLPAPPDRAELLELLGVAARGGSVQAMRLLLGELNRMEGDAAAPADEAPDPFVELDELSPRRRKRAPADGDDAC